MEGKSYLFIHNYWILLDRRLLIQAKRVLFTILNYQKASTASSTFRTWKRPLTGRYTALSTTPRISYQHLVGKLCHASVNFHHFHFTNLPLRRRYVFASACLLVGLSVSGITHTLWLNFNINFVERRTCIWISFCGNSTSFSLAWVFDITKEGISRECVLIVIGVFTYWVHDDDGGDTFRFRWDG